MAKRKTTRNLKLPARLDTKIFASARPLLQDLRSLILQTRERVAQAVNSALVLLYWKVGNRIRTEVLKSRRAGYGEEILSTLSKELSVEFGNGYSVPNLSRMTRFAENFPELKIVSALSAQLGWSHFVEIIPIDDPLKRARIKGVRNHFYGRFNLVPDTFSKPPFPNTAQHPI
jgi:hypothetical protein